MLRGVYHGVNYAEIHISASCQTAGQMCCQRSLKGRLLHILANICCCPFPLDIWASPSCALNCVHLMPHHAEHPPTWILHAGVSPFRQSPHTVLLRVCLSLLFYCCFFSKPLLDLTDKHRALLGHWGSSSSAFHEH